MAIDPGPSWWESQYGIGSLEAFESQTDGYFQGLIGSDPFRRQEQQIAYLDPGSVWGAYLAARLTGDSIGPDSQPLLSTLYGALQAAINNGTLKGSPMGQLIIPDCFQVNINATNGTQVVENVVGVRNAGGTAAGAAAAVKAAWEGSGVLTRLPPAYVLNSYRAVDISSAFGDIATVTSTAPGSNGTDQATAAACALWQWNGSTRSRSSRGRMYVGPLPENAIYTDGRTVEPTTVTAFNTTITTFLGSLASAGYPLVVLSRVLSQAFTVTTGRCETQIATQRRRIRG